MTTLMSTAPHASRPIPILMRAPCRRHAFLTLVWALIPLLSHRRSYFHTTFLGPHSYNCLNSPLSHQPTTLQQRPPSLTISSFSTVYHMMLWQNYKSEMWHIKMPQQNNKNKWNFNVLFNPINLKYQFKIITNKNYYHGIFHSLVHANLWFWYAINMSMATACTRHMWNHYPHFTCSGRLNTGGHSSISLPCWVVSLLLC